MTISCVFKGNPFGERLPKIAKEKKMLLMVCDQCAVRRGLADGTFEQCGSGQVKAKGLVDGVVAGCFPQLYTALGPNAPRSSYYAINQIKLLKYKQGNLKIKALAVQSYCFPL